MANAMLAWQIYEDEQNELAEWGQQQTNWEVESPWEFFIKNNTKTETWKEVAEKILEEKIPEIGNWEILPKKEEIKKKLKKTTQKEFIEISAETRQTKQEEIDNEKLRNQNEQKKQKEKFKVLLNKNNALTKENTQLKNEIIPANNQQVDNKLALKKEKIKLEKKIKKLKKQQKSTKNKKQTQTTNELTDKMNKIIATNKKLTDNQQSLENMANMSIIERAQRNFSYRRLKKKLEYIKTLKSPMRKVLAFAAMTENKKGWIFTEEIKAEPITGSIFIKRIALKNPDKLVTEHLNYAISKFKIRWNELPKEKDMKIKLMNELKINTKIFIQANDTKQNKAINKLDLLAA